MEIICNQGELNNAIQLVSKAVASRPTHPILANVLITADEVTKKVISKMIKLLKQHTY